MLGRSPSLQDGSNAGADVAAAAAVGVVVAWRVWFLGIAGGRGQWARGATQPVSLCRDYVE